ncbi:Tm-1-like ATP-binding domain-containing protein [bacterium]|nr:Tm-1-like ATP-binding domain-containing protein [bacterium]
MSVILIATLDTKGAEAEFLAEEMTKRGLSVCLIDAGILGGHSYVAEVSIDDVLLAAGTSAWAVRQKRDRGEAVTQAARGVEAVVMQLHREGKVAGIIALGGSAGTTIATAAMRALPFGIPKLMISTLASGQVRPFVGPRDIMMMHSVTDISGLNRISRSILGRAAAAMAGMIHSPVSNNLSSDRPILTATMFGVTTPCVEECRQLAERLGYEVLVFHAVGTGGEAMESLIADKLVAGVLDITTTELADELVGGVLTAGPQRLTAAARAGVPQVVSVGALDMVNFGPRDSVPAALAHRQFYFHNANVTLMRTTPEENDKLGRIIASKLSESTAPYQVFLPLGGISAIDMPGQPFWNPPADEALFAALRENLPASVIVECPEHINDPAFARRAVDALQSLLA